MKRLHAYLDKSGTDASAKYLCPNGYRFNADSALALDVAWGELLHKFGLPHFHRVDCAHGNGSFENVTWTDRTEALKSAIELIKTHASHGMACAIDVDAFQTIPTGALFETCIYFCLLAISPRNPSLGKRGQPEERKDYFSEQSHASQGEADSLFERLAGIPKLKKQYRYASDTFVQKTRRAAIQCADLLAWQ